MGKNLLLKAKLYIYFKMTSILKIWNSSPLDQLAIRNFFGLKATINKKRFFSYNSAVSMNNDPNLNQIKKKLDTIKEKGKQLQEESDDLKSDREMTKVHRLALVKKENNQTVNEEENNAISDIKENYFSYFDEPLSESDPEVETSPEYKERKQLNQVVEYINQELKNNRNEMEKLKIQWDKTKKIYKTLEGLSNTKSIAESSTSVNKASEPTSQSEPSDKANELTTQSEQLNKQNAQINQNTSDYIDNLPKQYNPLDDLGDD